MKKNYALTAAMSSAVFVAGYVLFAANLQASEQGDSAEITKLLTEAKAESGQLTHDADEMYGFSKSKLSWASFANRVEMVKEHINNAGKLLIMLQQAEQSGSLWQQAAIGQIEPLLRELAANTETTINYLNDKPSKVHMPAFQEYAKTNYELATKLEALIKDFVALGESKQKIESLRERLDVTN